MPLYTFHAFRADGAPLLWDAATLESCEEARDRAATMLDMHLSAQTVGIWLGDEQIATLEREDGWRASPSSGAGQACCSDPR